MGGELTLATGDGHLRVDFVGSSGLGLPGRLGLTSAPGRWRPGLDASSDWLLHDDLARLRDVHGAKVLVTLLEEFEMRQLGIPELLVAARKLRLESVWFPVQDFSPPPDLEATVALVDSIVTRLARGETVVVHCRGGLGRTGTIAACCLVARGRAPRSAIRLVRDARPGAVEVESQVEFVGRFARRLGRGA
jgi:predicted protein tyrosine phosphatase